MYKREEEGEVIGGNLSDNKHRLHLIVRYGGWGTEFMGSGIGGDGYMISALGNTGRGERGL